MSTNYPVPALDVIDTAFGNVDHLPKFEDLAEEFRDRTAPECKIASSLFRKGGRLSDHGLRVKPDLCSRGVNGAIQASLCSFKPKHEHKIAGVGALLRDWCEPTEES